MDHKKALSYLGIAKRSGNLTAGTDSVVKILASKKIRIIILAADASAGTKDKIIKKAYFYQIPVIELFSSLEISQAVGKSNVMVMAITDEGLCNALKKELEREASYEG